MSLLMASYETLSETDAEALGAGAAAQLRDITCSALTLLAHALVQVGAAGWELSTSYQPLPLHLPARPMLCVSSSARVLLPLHAPTAHSLSSLTMPCRLAPPSVRCSAWQPSKGWMGRRTRRWGSPGAGLSKAGCAANRAFRLHAHATCSTVHTFVSSSPTNLTRCCSSPPPS